MPLSDMMRKDRAAYALIHVERARRLLIDVNLAWGAQVAITARDATDELRKALELLEGEPV